MEYRQIRYFVLAAEYENFSRAAEELFVSPQSVAKQIALLERELGTKLFERAGKKVSLNQNGAYVYEKLKKAEDEMNEALRDIRAFIEDAGRKVRISFFSALPKKEFIAPLMNALLTKFPDFQLELRMLNINETIEQLVSGEADIVFTNIEEADDAEEIGRIVFFKKKAQIVVAPGHPWWGKDAVTAEEMGREEMIKLQAGKRLTNPRDVPGLYDRIPCRGERIVPNFETMYTILEQGKVFAVFPDSFTNVDNTDFHFLDLPMDCGSFDVAALFRRNNEKPAVKQVLRFLKNEWSI